MNFLASQFRTNHRMNATYGVLRSYGGPVEEAVEAGISGGYRVPSKRGLPEPEQREGEGEEGEEEFPDTEEELEEEEESVRSHIAKRAKSGFKAIVDKGGEAFMTTILPVLLDRIIGAIIGRINGPKAREGEPGAAVEGGARAINQMGKRYNVTMPIREVKRVLRTVRPGNQRQIHRRIAGLAR